LRASAGAVRLYTPMTPVRVMAVDHRKASRQAARELVAGTPGFTWLAQAASGEEALEAAIHVRPDLVLVEADMPGMDGLETRRRLEEAVPEAVVVLLSAEEDLSLETLTPEGLRALWNGSRPA
jgi:two-component system, NarL family, nitrate/nitrite response regulator NarL